MNWRYPILIGQFLIIIYLGIVCSALASPEPLSAEEQTAFQQQEHKQGAADVQAGDYGPVEHFLTTFDQLGLALLLTGLVILGLYAASKSSSLFKKNRARGLEKRKWSREFLDASGVTGNVDPLYTRIGGAQARIRDFSQGGAGLELTQDSQPVNPGDRVKLQLKADERTSLGELTGIIRWVAGKKLGIQFDSLDLSYKVLQTMTLTTDTA
ncbi:MAG: PilZ domain-containing protein [Desulfohalobiaceae bacterium]|nr:PilZ domain-containing protein [Desulfohalobiaceae bacterium]